MGNTFRFLQAGGVGTPAFCRPPAVRGGDDGGLPRVRSASRAKPATRFSIATRSTGSRPWPTARNGRCATGGRAAVPAKDRCRRALRPTICGALA